MLLAETGGVHVALQFQQSWPQCLMRWLQRLDLDCLGQNFKQLTLQNPSKGLLEKLVRLL